MRVHAVVPARKVLQVNHDDFADFRSYGGSEEAQPRRPGRLPAVRGVCELPEHGLLVNAANPLWFLQQEF